MFKPNDQRLHLHCGSIALTRKIHTLSILQSEMLGLLKLRPGQMSAAARFQFLGRGWSTTFALFHSTRTLQ